MINTEDPLSVATVKEEGETNDMALIPTIKRGTLHRGMTKIEGVRRLWKLVN